MAPDRYRFDPFLLDPGERQLTQDGVPLDLSARYLDALTLLVRNAGRLVSKDQFLAEVWRGVPVTDEALTQCIKTLRKQLRDDAGKPRYIETVPKHGYRFVAPVERTLARGTTTGAGQQPVAQTGNRRDWREALIIAGAGTLGAGMAGLIGGLFYGFIGASQALGPGVGGASVLLVLLWLCIAVALMGGAGVSFGIAGAGLISSSRWLVAGGAIGGLAVGAVVKLLGLDAFELLLGRSPGHVTGAGEGALIGATVGLAVFLDVSKGGLQTRRRRLALSAIIGGGAGVLITLLGGRMMGGSLEALGQAFPQSRLRLNPLGELLGEKGFGAISQILTGWLEGALFAGCIVMAMAVARRNLRRRDAR